MSDNNVISALTSIFWSLLYVFPVGCVVYSVGENDYFGGGWGVEDGLCTTQCVVYSVGENDYFPKIRKEGGNWGGGWGIHWGEEEERGCVVLCRGRER